MAVAADKAVVADMAVVVADMAVAAMAVAVAVFLLLLLLSPSPLGPTEPPNLFIPGSGYHRKQASVSSYTRGIQNDSKTIGFTNKNSYAPNPGSSCKNGPGASLLHTYSNTLRLSRAY